jgi:hypothetical protein
MSDTWSNISLKEITLLAAEKVNAATAAKVSSSSEEPAASSAAGEKRGSSSQTPILPAVAKRGSSSRKPSPPEVSSTPPPSNTGGDSQTQQPESAGVSLTVVPPATTFDPVSAGVIPSNLLFGPYGCLGDAALKEITTLPRDSLSELAVELNLFPDVASIPSNQVVSVPALRHLISAATGKAASYEVDDNKSFSFPDGVELEKPHFRQPAA